MLNKNLNLKYLFTNISVVFGVVLVWRGIWYILDQLDKWLFGGSHFWTALVGIIIGLLILYFPDRDSKEIGKL